MPRPPSASTRSSRTPRTTRWKWLLILLALGVIPAILILLVVYWLFGREFKTGYDREYEQEPPSDLAPALVPTLLRQGGEAGSYEFTATLFDLIRRDVYNSKPVTTEISTFAGLHKTQLSDLELSPGKPDATLLPWEQDVANVVDGVLDGGTEDLSKFRGKIESKRTSMAPRFTAFKSHISKEVKTRKWFLDMGIVPLTIAFLVFVAVGVLLFIDAASRWRPTYVRWSDVELIGLGVASIINALVIAFGMTRRPLWRRCSRDCVTEAEKWGAFRRYLTDFPRLKEAPPATLELWERYLVYGIAFGIAERVLQAAHIAMPEALAQQSTIYWISPSGNLGGGASSLAIGDLASGLRIRSRAAELGVERVWRRLLRWGRRRRGRRRRRRRLVGGAAGVPGSAGAASTQLPEGRAEARAGRGGSRPKPRFPSPRARREGVSVHVGHATAR